jgi:hypothetical protein
MQNQDLFDQYPTLSTDKLLRKVIRVSWEVDYLYLFNCIKNLPYQEYLKVRKRVIDYAVLSLAVKNTEDSKAKYWEKIVNHLEKNFEYRRPESYSKDAERMRKRRAEN